MRSLPEKGGPMKRVIACVGLILVSVSQLAAAPGAGHANNIVTENHAFGPGEKLTYTISWSNIFQAGVAVLELSEEKTSDGKDVYRLISTARSTGIVSKFYKVMDTVESFFDARELYSLSYRMDQNHGKRKKQRDMTFNHASGKVTVTADGIRETYDVPPRVQDALSSLYYLRTRSDFTVERPIIIDIHDSGKNWSVEILTLGKEKLKTPLGEFNTIKLKTYPKYDGVFMHKGEIIIWVTDDNRKIPLLMKSTISIGSIIATLTEFKQGDLKQ